MTLSKEDKEWLKNLLKYSSNSRSRSSRYYSEPSSISYNEPTPIRYENNLSRYKELTRKVNQNAESLAERIEYEKLRRQLRTKTELNKLLPEAAQQSFSNARQALSSAGKIAASSVANSYLGQDIKHSFLQSNPITYLLYQNKDLVKGMWNVGGKLLNAGKNAVWGGLEALYGIGKNKFNPSKYKKPEDNKSSLKMEEGKNYIVCKTANFIDGTNYLVAAPMTKKKLIKNNNTPLLALLGNKEKDEKVLDVEVLNKKTEEGNNILRSIEKLQKKGQIFLKTALFAGVIGILGAIAWMNKDKIKEFIKKLPEELPRRIQEFKEGIKNVKDTAIEIKNLVFTVANDIKAVKTALVNLLPKGFRSLDPLKETTSSLNNLIAFDARSKIKPQDIKQLYNKTKGTSVTVPINSYTGSNALDSMPDYLKKDNEFGKEVKRILKDGGVIRQYQVYGNTIPIFFPFNVIHHKIYSTPNGIFYQFIKGGSSETCIVGPCVSGTGTEGVIPLNTVCVEVKGIYNLIYSKDFFKDQALDFHEQINTAASNKFQHLNFDYYSTEGSKKINRQINKLTHNQANLKAQASVNPFNYNSDELTMPYNNIKETFNLEGGHLQFSKKINEASNLSEDTINQNTQELINRRTENSINNQTSNANNEPDNEKISIVSPSPEIHEYTTLDRLQFNQAIIIDC